MVDRWEPLAAEARRLIEAQRGTSVSDRWPPEVHAAIRVLQAAVAETEDPLVAEWAVSRWLVESRFTIGEAVAEEKRDPTPARLRRAGESGGSARSIGLGWAGSETCQRGN